MARTTDFPAVTSDYYPTLLDYLQLSVPNQKPLDGISLRPLIEDTVTTRAQPIGFKINAHNSWTSQQYKIIDKGSGWELYDLLNVAPGEEVEETPIATESNINSQSSAIQTVYQNLVDEFTAWDASVTTDTVYSHSSRPSATLETTGVGIDLPFLVTAKFSEPVSQLLAHEIVLENATLSGFTGSNDTYTFAVEAIAGSEYIVISIPEGAAIDVDGNPNLPSNDLALGELPPIEAGPVSIDIDFGAVVETAGFYNNVTSQGSLNLLDDTGSTTGISLNLIGGSFAGSGASYNGPYPTEIDEEPSTALSDSLFIRNNGNGNSVTITLSGLISATTYDFVIYGARGNNGLESIWTVTDNQGVDVKSISNPVNNATEVITFSDLMPTSDGRIVIDFTSEVSGSSGAAMNYLNISSAGDLDSDFDGMFDSYEQANGTDLNFDDADEDLDGDGLSNIQEYRGQDASGEDSGFGQTLSGTADMDGDGLFDGDEFLNGANPFLADTDGDEFNDYIEVVKGSLPASSSSTPTSFPNMDWGVQIFDSETLLSNDGVLLFAENYAGSEVALNGINFASATSLNESKSSSNLVTLLTENADINVYDDEVPALSPLLESFWWKSGTTGTNMGIIGLTPGSTYQVQMGRADDRAGSSIVGRYAFADSLQGNDSSAPVGPNNTIYGGPSAPALLFTGTFVADSPVQVFSTGQRASSGTLSGSQIAFLQVRELVYPIIVERVRRVAATAEIEFEGLQVSKIYQLVRSTNLETFSIVVDGPRLPNASEDTFIDPAAPVSKAFYRLEEVAP